MSERWTIELLGGLRLRHGQRIYRHFRSEKTAALLAYLAYHSKRTHPREELIERWWPSPDYSPERGRGNLSIALSALRSQLELSDLPAEAVLVADRTTVRLDPDRITTDVAGFEAALQAAARATGKERAAYLMQAIERYTGRLLPGLYDDWIVTEQQYLQERFLEAVRTLLSYLEQTGERARALEIVQCGLREAPDHPELLGDLERLKAMAIETAASLSASPLSPPAPPTFTNTLPRPLSRFHGRESEQKQLETLLLSPGVRLVTLTGPGGNGKTRLALETGHRLADLLANAVWFVPLEAVERPDRIFDAILDAVCPIRSPEQEPFDQVIQMLSQRPSLLILDNFEQLAAEGALQVRALLQQAPQLTCLITSRQTLALSGEREFPLAPLPVPTETHPNPDALRRQASIQLFVDRVQAQRPDFNITDANASILAKLCCRLEGIPLALELAAGRAQVMTPEQILAGLDRRLDFLVSRQRDTPPRHRTIRSVMDLSYHLLSPWLQRLFAHLSVFRGGWTAEAAAEVCGEGDLPDHLADLRACSLILAEPRGTEMRFRMLETLREYAAEQCSPEEMQMLRRRHRAWCLALAEQSDAALKGEEPAVWLERLEREHDNLRASLAWPEEAETRMRLACALFRFWNTHNYFQEGYRWFEEILAQSLEIPEALRAKALNRAGLLAVSYGNYQTAHRCYAESLALQERLGDRRGMMIALINQGNLDRRLGDNLRAREVYERCLALCAEMDSQEHRPVLLMNLGLTALALDEIDSARRLCEEALLLSREQGNHLHIAAILHNLGAVQFKLKNYSAARRLFQESLLLNQELSDRLGLTLALFHLGFIATCEEDNNRAMRLLGAAEAMREAIGSPLRPDDQGLYEQAVAELQTHFDSVTFYTLWEEGRTQSLEAILDYATTSNA